MKSPAAPRKKEAAIAQLQAIVQEIDSPALRSAVEDLLDGQLEDSSRSCCGPEEGAALQVRAGEDRSLEQRDCREALTQVQTYAEELAAAIEELRLANEELNQTNEVLHQKNAELVAARTAVEQERERYYDLFDAAPDGYLVTDRRGTIREANRAAASLLAVHKESLRGRSLINFVARGSQEMFQTRLDRAADGRPEQDWDVQLQPVGGESVWVSASIASVRSGDAADPSLRWTVRDVTERRRAGAALKEYAARLARSNEELQRFAYVASHDLQEPLRSVVSFSQLLERRYKGQLDQDADEYIGFIVQGGMRMQNLIQDLLRLSRVETQAKPPVPTDAGRPAREALAVFNGQIVEIGGTVTIGPLPRVMADPAQLEQVFANLIGNAIKYRRADVPLEVTISAERLDGLVEFSVRDNGIGIEPEYFDRIFEMFRRLHTHDAYEGTGIGLAVVKRIVDRHGGACRVESTPGEGSTFYFTLPAA
jgi:PAS domain S-box-containing protein